MRNDTGKLATKLKKQQRVRLKIRGVRPRLSVFRSNTSIYAQIIDDTKGVTLAQANQKEVKEAGKRSEVAFQVGKLLAEKATKAKVKEVVFDRGSYSYHGRVKALAEGAREGGLQF